LYIYRFFFSGGTQVLDELFAGVVDTTAPSLIMELKYLTFVGVEKFRAICHVLILGVSSADFEALLPLVRTRQEFGVPRPCPPNSSQKGRHALYLDGIRTIFRQMGCPALGIWVAFLKQPDALPGRAPQKIKMIYF
jgi:hypothetical protein